MSATREQVSSPIKHHKYEGNSKTGYDLVSGDKHNSLKMPSVSIAVYNPGEGEEITFPRIRAQNAISNKYREMFGMFKVDEEVLARWADGLYYLGLILEVNDYTQKCSLKFEDGSKFWVHFKDLYRSQDNIDEGTAVEDISCNICLSKTSKNLDEIVICDKCGQGFHQLCHLPNIADKELQNENMTWQCRNCVFVACVRAGGAKRDSKEGKIMQEMKRVLPYDMESLTWSKGHKSNSEEVYCYCGGPGDWYLKMLQCCRCQQWFHEACLQCLDCPLMYGDRYFLFVCTPCNQGNEYITRLPLKWADAVHLVLYNITIAHKNTYYDLTDVIIPSFISHWKELRLQQICKEIPPTSQLKAKVLNILQSHKTRFRLGVGNEIKKNRTCWGLKKRSPPFPPCPTVPPGIIISDEILPQLDLKHGATTSSALSDSPTPLKKVGPCGGPCSTEGFSRQGNGDSLDGDELPFKRQKLFHSKRRGRPRKSKLSADNSHSPVTSSSGKSLPERKRKRGEESCGSSYASESSSAASQFLNNTNGFGSVGKSYPVEMRQLKNVVAKYFGPEERVASGERFRILGKRSVEGTTGSKWEYLIEWEGCTPVDLMKKP